VSVYSLDMAVQACAQVTVHRVAGQGCQWACWDRLGGDGARRLSIVHRETTVLAFTEDTLTRFCRDITDTLNDLAPHLDREALTRVDALGDAVRELHNTLSEHRMITVCFELGRFAQLCDGQRASRPTSFGTAVDELADLVYRTTRAALI
jgi:hypothetical protein